VKTPTILPDELDFSSKLVPRRYPVGAEALTGNRVSVRVWAPKCERVSIAIESGGIGLGVTQPDARSVDLKPEDSGYFSAVVDGMPVGSLYRFHLDGDKTPYPDPASRF